MIAQAVTVEVSTVVQILVASGLLTAVGETIRWYFGRGKTKVDNAAVVQGMAIDLLKPLNEQLKQAEIRAQRLSTQMNDMDHEMEIIISWALTAKGLLEQNHIDAPPLPKIKARPNW